MEAEEGTIWAMARDKQQEGSMKEEGSSVRAQGGCM
jgi:hypothetical protein